jgi:hypothetical protein
MLHYGLGLSSVKTSGLLQRLGINVTAGALRLEACSGTTELVPLQRSIVSAVNDRR